MCRALSQGLVLQSKDTVAGKAQGKGRAIFSWGSGAGDDEPEPLAPQVMGCLWPRSFHLQFQADSELDRFLPEDAKLARCLIPGG